MPAPPTTRPRLLTVAVIASALFVGLLPLASAQVTGDDLEAAEADAANTSALLEAARDELAQVTDLEARLAATLESLTSRQADVGDSAAAEAVAIRGRLSRMYMAAGRPDVLIASVSDVAGFFTRLAYLGAIADRDREEVNRFVLVVADLSALRGQAEQELEDLAAEAAALELVVASRTAARDQAAARLVGLREEWERQEAARRAALAAEIRRQEEALAQAAATTTTTTTATTVAAPGGGSTTTTTTGGGFSTDDGGYTFDPGGGVEQWRPLLSQVFARWGLDTEKCGPNGCLGSHIDDALTIMWCESRGVPFAVNPSSSTTGLFQHRPVYWADRVARTRAKPWASLPANATPYNPAHNIEVAALLIWESRETILGNLSYGRPWSDGPQPFGHWDGTSRYCADPPLVWP